MKKIGLICEYNPFHNGHLYHIEKVKEMRPDSILILALGGGFLERGEISLISKWNKTRLALDYGIDLVLEIPTLYGTNSADYFAASAIRALEAAGVEEIIFGSESDDIDFLYRCAQIQNTEKFTDSIKNNLSKGKNYPSSIAKSLDVSLASNDILGVSYIKAIEKHAPQMRATTIKRTNDFLDTASDKSLVSAQNIRKKLTEGACIEKYIPNYDINFINRIDEYKLFELIRYRIITESHLERFLGVDEGLENRLKKTILNVDSYDELLNGIKSKRYTTSRLRRMLIHILLGIEKTDMQNVQDEYHILGFNELGRAHLRELGSPNLVYKMTGRTREIEEVAALIYYDITRDETAKEEFLNKPIIKL